MKVTVDRIEGDYAICELENRQMINIPLKDIPFLLKEGDVIEINGNSYKFDAEETKKKKKKIEDMTKGLWE
jgi:hypothetical protein